MMKIGVWYVNPLEVRAIVPWPTEEGDECVVKLSGEAQRHIDRTAEDMADEWRRAMRGWAHDV